VVYWAPRPTLKKLFWQYFSYAKWDARAGLLLRLPWTRKLLLAHLILLFFIILGLVHSPIWLFILLSIVAIYLLMSGLIVLRETRNLRSLLIGPSIKVTIFLAETFGVLRGICNRIGICHKNEGEKWGG